MKKDNIISKLANEILAGNGLAKEAKEREGRIEGYKNYFLNDPIQRGSLEAKLDLAENRAERARIKSDMKGAPKDEKAALKSKLKALKKERSATLDKAQGTFGQRLKAMGGYYKTTLKNNPHNLLVPGTPGNIFDTDTALTLAQAEIAKKKAKFGDKAAAVYADLMEKSAAVAEETNAVTEAAERAATVYERAQLSKQAAEECFNEALELEKAALEALKEFGYEIEK